MSFDLVLFGGTGDLAWRKLMPALFQAFRHGSLPPGGRIIGVAVVKVNMEYLEKLWRENKSALYKTAVRNRMGLDHPGFAGGLLLHHMQLRHALAE